MSKFRPGRALGITVGAVAILVVGVYGPATLLGPLPMVKSTVVSAPAAAATATPPVLPATGTSAVVSLVPPAAGATTPATTVAATPIAAAGSTTPLPMAAAAKIVAALVVLSAKPLDAGAAGPGVPITPADYQDYLDYVANGARTVIVFPGETWTEQELLQAMILGSSNNHADTIARWAFGSVDAYVTAANAWLAKEGLTGIHVADATGLAVASAGTGADLARLAGLAATNPVISGILASPASALVGQRGVDNTTAYLPEEGITGLSRSYTDAGGVCFLFTATVGTAPAAFTFAGAVIGEPDYDALTADLKALMASAKAGVTDLPILAEGAAYVRFDAPWDATASGVVKTGKTRFGWQAAPVGAATLDLEAFATGRSGATVGRVTVDASGEAVTSPLVLDATISAPGPGWRLLNPVPMISALLEQ